MEANTLFFLLSQMVLVFLCVVNAIIAYNSMLWNEKFGWNVIFSIGSFVGFVAVSYAMISA